MKMVLVQTPTFASQWARLGLGDDDARELESLVMERPSGAPVMRGTGGLRKIRFAPSRWRTGKSGALRVCYVWFERFSQAWFVTVFAKNEQANLSARECAEIRGLIARIQAALTELE